MTILEQCKEVFQDARRSVFEGIALLHQISEEKSWEGSYSSFGEYCEQELQLHPTAASRYLTSYKHFVIEGKQDFSTLKGIDPERLYLAAKLSMPVDQQLVRASSWGRRELRDELASHDGHDCEHPSTIKICAVCNKRV